MSDSRPTFQLSSDIEQYLAAVSKLYAQEGEILKQKIVVNSQVRVHERWSYDNWNGGISGHALYLTVPEALYLRVAKDRGKFQNEIKSDINNVHNFQDEFIEEVFLEMEKVKDREWRRESGVLQLRGRIISPSAALRIWGADGYRLFISHKNEVKKKASKLKEGLAVFGISSFVAHQDIKPTKEWQDEIESALGSMDAFVAVLTDKFHESLWTDQEVGYALGRRVPMIALKLGSDPYGFIGKFQALRCSWDSAPLEIAKLLMGQGGMLDAYVIAVPKCQSFDQGNALSQVLPSIENVTEEQAGKLVRAFNKNTQLKGSFGFNGSKPHLWGNGLAAELSRMTGEKYVVSDEPKIRRA